MAERRMFAKSIVLSDAFLDLPLSSRCLYFTLGMVADDDGFVGNPKAIMRQCGASQDDMVALLQKRFLLTFESGVIVIKHWRMNNYLQNDRHKSTTYLEELSTLTVDEKGAYTELHKDTTSCNNEPCIQNVYKVYTQDRLGKDRLDYITSKEVICEPNSSRTVVEKWNSLGLSQVTKVSASSNRGKMLNARIKDYGLDKVLEAIDNIKQSSFLQGQNKNGWVITFEWFVKPNNFVKVLEGNYDDTRHGKGNNLHDFLDKLDKGELTI